MEVNRKGGELTIRLDSEEDAIGLYAVLSGHGGSVPPEVFEKGQWMYAWLFNNVQKLAFNHQQEASLATMSPETANGPPKRAPK